MNNYYYFSENCVKLVNGNRIILENNMNGESIKLSKECFDILEVGILEKLSHSEVINAIEDLEDKEYFISLFDKLFESLIIVNENEAWAINSVNIDITHRCNLSCIHCSMSAVTMNEQEKLTTDTWIDIIDKIIKLEPKSICISGGEPLVRKDIWDILDYLKKNFDGKLSIMTNGLLINEKNVNKLVSIFDEFNISIDGVDEETCSLIRGKGVFQKVMDSVELLKNNKITKISLSMVDVKGTHGSIQRFYQLNEELGTFPIIRAFNDEGRGEENKESLMNQENLDYNKLILVAEDIAKDKRQRPQGFNCGAGRTEFHVDSKGDLYPCAPLEYEEFCFGNVVQISDLKRYIKNREYIKSRSYKSMENLMPHKNEKCCDCNVNMFCWQCLHDLYKNQKYNKEFDDKCKLKKKELECLW